MMILTLFQHMYEVEVFQELQVMLQAFTQNQVQLLIQVEFVATNLNLFFRSHIIRIL